MERERRVGSLVHPLKCFSFDTLPHVFFFSQTYSFRLRLRGASKDELKDIAFGMTTPPGKRGQRFFVSVVDF